MVYLLETLVWMKTKDAQKKAPLHRPKPYVPEWMGGEVAKDAEVYTVDELQAILNKPRV